MWNIPIRKFSSATIKSRQSGQAILEYMLILMVVVGIFVFVGRPAINKLRVKLRDGMKTGIFTNAEDNTGKGFYYFPVK